MYMMYKDLDTYCFECRGNWEDAVEEVEVCQTLSSKSTWEICWENSTGEHYFAGRQEELRAYVLGLLQG